MDQSSAAPHRPGPVTLPARFRRHSVSNGLILVISLVVVAFVALIATTLIISRDGAQYATLINETGKIRGGTQRIAKLELARQGNDSLIEQMELRLQTVASLNDSLLLKTPGFSRLCRQLDTYRAYWDRLREDIRQFRQPPHTPDRLLSDSETMWALANEMVGLAEENSHYDIYLYYTLAAVGALGVLCLLLVLVVTKVYVRDRIEYLADHDPLTGLYNRYYFEQAFERIWLAAQRGQPPFAVMICDIDHFKRVNDRFGHDAGDTVLEGVARTLRETARRTDLIARQGGEEFVVLAMDLRPETSFFYAERLRLAVASQSFLEGIQVTISIGIACYSPGQDRKTLLKKADEALYQAKNSGRNCIRGSSGQ